MGLMLPRGTNPYDDGTVEGRMGGIASRGYLAVARSSAELGRTLDKIKVGCPLFCVLHVPSVLRASLVRRAGPDPGHKSRYGASFVCG